jgi:small subunit ribosomal protein S6
VNKVAGDVPAAGKQVVTLLEKHGAEVLANRPWDERRLSYPIGKHKKGLYYLTYFRMNDDKVKNLQELQRDVGLSELILRSLVLKVEPKMVDTMLALAKDEHALALQMMHDDGTDDTGRDSYRGGGDRRDRDRDRGGRRTEVEAGKEG